MRGEPSDIRVGVRECWTFVAELIIEGIVSVQRMIWDGNIYVYIFLGF